MLLKMSPAINLPVRERMVIKIGGSVLNGNEAYICQAKRIIEFSEKSLANRIYIVISARKGHTDELIDELCQDEEEKKGLRKLLKVGNYNDEGNENYIQKFDHHYVASYLLKGEIDSVKRFEKEFRRRGIYPETLIQGVNFPIIANGKYLHANVDLEASKQTSHLNNLSARIVLVSGFGAQNHYGEKVLLGRNASDYVAALLGKLDENVREVIYLKDVDGIFENFKTNDEKMIERIRAIDLLNEAGKLNGIKGDCSKVLDKRCLECMLECNGNRVNGTRNEIIYRIQNCLGEIGKGGTLILP